MAMATLVLLLMVVNYCEADEMNKLQEDIMKINNKNDNTAKSANK